MSLTKLWIIFFRFLSYCRLLTSIVSAFEVVESLFIDYFFFVTVELQRDLRDLLRKEQSRMQKVRHEIKKGNENDYICTSRISLSPCVCVCVCLFLAC